jgi:hypothetical protein
MQTLQVTSEAGESLNTFHANEDRLDQFRLTLGDLASCLMLRTDFGRVLQQFPIDNSVKARGGGEMDLVLRIQQLKRGSLINIRRWLA